MDTERIVEDHISSFVIGDKPLVSTKGGVGCLEFLGGGRDHTTVQHIDIKCRDALFLCEMFGTFIELFFNMASERYGVLEVTKTASIDSDVTYFRSIRAM